MVEAAQYSAVESLRNGQPIELRALRRSDEAELLAAAGRTSGQSLYRRFFEVKRGFSAKEVSFFLNIDFVKHVALVAVAHTGGREMIVGGGRYVVARPGSAELAFTIEDDYQGQGIGGALLRHLIGLARVVLVNQPIDIDQRLGGSGLAGQGVELLRHGSAS